MVLSCLTWFVENNILSWVNCCAINQLNICYLKKCHFLKLNYVGLLLSVSQYPTFLMTGLNSEFWNKVLNDLHILIFQNSYDCFNLFFFHVHFRISLWTSTQQSCWNFDCYCFESTINLGRINILRILSLLIHKHGISPCSQSLNSQHKGYMHALWGSYLSFRGLGAIYYK